MLISTHSEIGQRNLNQDKFFTEKKGSSLIMAVADGHGKDGEVVAEKAIHEIIRAGFTMLKNPMPWFLNLHEKIIKKTEKSVGGSTLSIYFKISNRHYIYQIGDSPIYVKSGTEIQLFRGHGVDFPENSKDFDRAIEAGGTPYWQSNNLYLANASKRNLLRLTRALGDSSFGNILGREPFILELDSKVDSVLVASDGFAASANETYKLMARREKIESFVKAQESRGIYDNLTLCLAYLY